MPARIRTDEELLEAYRTGETGAIAVLIDRYQPDLLRFLSRLCGSRTLAEDVFQETFLQIHLSADTFDVSRRFKPWLFTIAANKARDALRRNARRKTLDLSAPIGGNSGGSGGGGKTYVDLMEVDVPPPGGRAESEERDRLVQRAIDQMPELLREILLLAYFQRMSYTQIAEVLEIPLGTVKSRLHAAVASFAKAWSSVQPSVDEDNHHRHGGRSRDDRNDDA